ncbi:hypothetical protein [Paenibacillus sp. oral taxon 786]|uniref:hypothetical protein n=1 Tax=Paenibacillus sp. oral taxon 786 TaxID=652715 RepID=UPI002FC2F308
MRKPGKRAVIYAIFLMILLILAFAGSVVISSPERPASEVEPFTSPIQRLGEADPAESALLTPDTMKADFDYLISTLEQVHPSLIDGWQREQRKKNTGYLPDDSSRSAAHKPFLYLRCRNDRATA